MVRVCWPFMERVIGMPGHPTEHAGLEVLPFTDCFRLLASVTVGRVGFDADGEVVILPVNHAVDGQDVVFRTARGSKLSAAAGQSVVAFEVDAYDPQTRSGWSVLVNGRAQVVYEDAEIQRLSRLGLDPWGPAGDRPFWVRIRPTAVSGRQIPASRRMSR
jgi:nitroimidazol reductase NimA-like FMN-containing flavoprotein (pyridoxamine 5'-phosphate oxidase superfamily)